MGADNAVGNVTGSNAVNVFLGVGISWTLGALYWQREGVTDTWLRYEHGGKSFKDLFLDKHPEGGFFVDTSTLPFSVGIYSVCAFLCLGLLAYRRHLYGGELGGPQHAQYRDSSLFASLWVIFIVCTAVRSVI